MPEAFPIVELPDDAADASNTYGVARFWCRPISPPISQSPVPNRIDGVPRLDPISLVSPDFSISGPDFPISEGWSGGPVGIV